MATKHGFSTRTYRHSLYQRWVGMKQRCLNPNSDEFHNYGAVGVKVCDEWKNSFVAFINDMGECPKGFQLDRINPTGNYEPSNCRWVSPKVNSRNRRDARKVIIEGTEYHVLELAEQSGLKADTIMNRLKKVSTLKELMNPEKHFCRVTPRRDQRIGHKSHCKHGHPYDDINTYWTPDGTRQCRTCRSRQNAKRVKP